MKYLVLVLLLIACTNTQKIIDDPEITHNSSPSVNNTLKETYCEPEQRGAIACITIYEPVCGFFDKSVQCIKSPCAKTYPNKCNACSNPEVSYYISGECPDN